MQFWNELEGQTIDGLYPLRRLVRSEGRRAWFETETGQAGNAPATISLTEALTDADEVTARLQAAQSIQHPNLVNITRVGQVRLDNTLIVYALTEHIEQSLSDVLQMQALSADEVREVAEAMVAALTAIHQKGMSHGHVEATSVLATEETVKLRSDCLQANTSGQADDVAGIGATVFHAFTQRKALSATDAQINRIPAPFAEIVRNSFTRRWTLGQIANVLKPAVPLASAIPVAAAPVVTPAPMVTPAPVPAPAQSALPFDATVAAPPRVPERAAPVAPSLSSQPAATVPPMVNRPAVFVRPPVAVAAAKAEPTSRPLGLYAGLSFLVLAVVVWLFWPKSTQAPTKTPPPAAQTSTQAPAVVVANPGATKTPDGKPSAAATSARRAKTVQAAVPAAAGGRPMWHVVVYTYRGETKAAAAVKKLSDQHSDLDISIFHPGGSVYLVTVGGAMDHPQAVAMLDKARRKGLPGDTYIRNFPE